MPARDAVLTDDNLIIKILTPLPSHKGSLRLRLVGRAGQVCHLWSAATKQQQFWREYSNYCWPGVAGQVRAQDWYVFFKTMRAAEKKAAPMHPTPTRLEDCMLMLRSGAGPVQASGQPTRVARCTFDLADAAAVRYGRLVISAGSDNPDRDLNFAINEAEDIPRLALAVTVPGVTEFFDSVRHSDELADILASGGYDDPFDLLMAFTSCTLVSKLDGRVVRLTEDIQSVGSYFCDSRVLLDARDGIASPPSVNIGLCIAQSDVVILNLAMPSPLHWSSPTHEEVEWAGAKYEERLLRHLHWQRD